MARIETLVFNGYEAIIIHPEKPNGQWIWKTEFLYAFDQAECELLDRGYTRVYYQISDKYGSPSAMQLMESFYHFVVEKFFLNKKCHMFGFSRGGLYAFNFALAYPDFVQSLYLDAPVLDLKTWPPKGSMQQMQMLAEYRLNERQFDEFKGSPIDKLEDFCRLNIPLLVIAGRQDEVVPFVKNAGLLIDFCKSKGKLCQAIVKPNGLHHPHSLENIQPILDFIGVSVNETRTI